MLQKVIRVGNSYAVTIPKSFVEAIKLPKNSFVKIKPETEKGRIILDFIQEKEVVTEVVDQEVYKVGKNLLKRYLPAFKELAKK